MLLLDPFVNNNALNHRRIQELKLGAKVERQRRDPIRGAEGAKGCWVWGGGVPLPTGDGSGKKAVLLPQKNFLDIKAKMAYFRGLCAKLSFFL